MRIKEGYLPIEARDNLLGYTTYDRWHTSLPAAVSTVSDAIADAGIAKDSAIMISDGSPQRITNEVRASHLEKQFEHNGGTPDTPIYILTQRGQQQVVDGLEKRTKLPRRIIESVVAGTSCGDNRQKLAVVSGAYVTGTNRSLVLGYMDDDIKVPPMYQRATGYGERPNSQVIMDMRRNGHTVFESRPNGSIASDFLNIPGKTLAELRTLYPNMPATQTWTDSMHRQLNLAQKEGLAVFDLNPSGEPIPEAVAWGVSAIKHRKPDYRTVEVAKASLLEEFPTHELPIESFPAGPNMAFAFRECDTNVDAAFSAWAVNDRTARLPFSFIISREISLQNPLKTVTTNTRADNELLPTLLPKIHQKTGTSLVYVTGVDLQVEHLRESSGYRPNIIEQAATSLVDNLYAQAANELMEFKDMYPSMNSAAIDEYIIPEERARGVFGKLQELAQISQNKIYELSRRTTHSKRGEELLETNVQKYREVYQTLKGKLGVTRYEEETGKKEVPVHAWDNVAFKAWEAEINIIGREQLHYYNNVLRATPIITKAVQDMINEGVYPVAQVVPEDDPSISTPAQPTKSLNP